MTGRLCDSHEYNVLELSTTIRLHCANVTNTHTQTEFCVWKPKGNCNKNNNHSSTLCGDNKILNCRPVPLNPYMHKILPPIPPTLFLQFAKHSHFMTIINFITSCSRGFPCLPFFRCTAAGLRLFITPFHFIGTSALSCSFSIYRRWLFHTIITCLFKVNDICGTLAQYSEQGFYQFHYIECGQKGKKN